MKVSMGRWWIGCVEVDWCVGITVGLLFTQGRGLELKWAVIIVL